VMYFPSTHAWSTKHIPDTYPWLYDESYSLWSPNSLNFCSWLSAYKRRVLLPVIPEDRSHRNGIIQNISLPGQLQLQYSLWMMRSLFKLFMCRLLPSTECRFEAQETDCDAISETGTWRVSYLVYHLCIEFYSSLHFHSCVF
jgi:hypothetical protein